MKVSKIMLAAASVVALASAAVSADTYIGFTGTGNAVGANYGTASDARQYFIDNVLGGTSYLIEDFSAGNAWTAPTGGQGGGVSLAGGLSLSFEDSISGPVASPTGTLSPLSGSAKGYSGVRPSGLIDWGDFQGLASGTTASGVAGNDGNNWVGFNGQLELTFAPGQTAVGFLLNDASEPVRRTITITYQGLDDLSNIVTEDVVIGGTEVLSNNNVYFVGFAKDNFSIASIVLNSGSASDGLGIDDILLSNPGGGNVIPLPPAAVAGMALMGLVGMKRRLANR